MTTGHLTIEEVAGYLDDILSEAVRSRVKAHLADCDPCRAEVVSASKLLERVPQSKRRVITLSALAAAAAVVIIVGQPSMDSEPGVRRPLRGNDAPFASEGVASVQAVSPIGKRGSGDPILFVWRQASPEAKYRFTLTDERGGKIWTGSTNDTTITLPDRPLVRENTSYQWYVDALLPDGSSATTGIVSFRIAR